MIWKTNLRRLHKLNEDRVQNGLKAVEFDEKSIVKYAEKHLGDLKWNGRQIRNAFQTAIALADFEASDSADKVPTMTKKHFAKLGKAAAEFDEYLESVHGSKPHHSLFKVPRVLCLKYSRTYHFGIISK